MRFYDTKQRAVVEFAAPNQMTMYVCGITPYDAAHLGHIFTFMTYDVLIRRLRDLGTTVRMVRNVTDVDEPIYIRARENGEPYRVLAQRETASFDDTMDQLGFIKPDATPLASEYIGPMAEAVKQLLDSNFAYYLDDDVYFDTSRSREFGKMSHFGTHLMIELAKERGGDPDRAGKRSRLDFLLWRSIADHADPAAWDSAVGHGRPGWHIECTVMSTTLLGTPITIHGGGMDLIFPHHEAEIAQAEGLGDLPFTQHFLHVAPLSRWGEKMSKSLGNLIFARDLLKDGSPAAVRLAMMHYHWRIGGEWCDDIWHDSKRLARDLSAYLRRDVRCEPRGLVDRVRGAIDNNLDTRAAIRLITAHMYGKGDARELREALALVGISL